MKLLVTFYWDRGRMGDVEGLFVTTEEDLDAAYGERVYLGEVLGEYSEIFGDLARKDITILSEDQEKIEWLQSLPGMTDTISGYNPLNYLDEE